MARGGRRVASSPVPIDVWTLSDGGQKAEAVAERVAGFLRPARETLELALYDVRLPDPVGSLVADELRAAHERGVVVRLVYNSDEEGSGRPPELHPPPNTRPEILEQLPIEIRAVPGVPDLMHHKYVVRDGEAVWTGSANWTVDSWTRQENVLAIVEDSAVAAAYRVNFEELWERQDVQHSGLPEPIQVDVEGAAVRAWFTPGQGEDLSQAIASAMGRARSRVRIASPVITSAPVLGTLGELAGRQLDVAGVVDAPQVATVFKQWADNGHSSWKIPLLATVLSRLPFSGKQSIPWRADGDDPHNFMHAKVTVADDVAFLGSFNLSRSGEQNAENVLEIHDAKLADRLAGFIDEVRERYPPVELSAQAAATISAGSSSSSAIPKS
ncbi:MAG: phosphatidylserine/phosphatidylglycerophosphate/cardiolipin synthase family protein [Solirubrobacterales bacterium]|nr:phosphatidylserine/phosphatidylglycerophosphate/cardiolipin synthase family protein [Solirubrobacterales bacterium]